MATKMCFRLLAGQHVQRKPPTGTDKDGRPVYDMGSDGLPVNDHFDWRWNNIIESETDLVERFNSKDPGLLQKFERITDSQGALIRKEREEARRWALEELRREQGISATEFPGAPLSQNPLAGPAPVVTPVVQSAANRPDFDRMSERDLRQHAADEEIDLGGAKSRDEVLRKVKASVAQPAAAAGKK